MPSSCWQPSAASYLTLLFSHLNSLSRQLHLARFHQILLDIEGIQLNIELLQLLLAGSSFKYVCEMVLVEEFPMSLLRPFLPNAERPRYRGFPRNSEETAEFVDNILHKIWEYPRIVNTRGCFTLDPHFEAEAEMHFRGLLKIKRNPECNVEEIRRGNESEYIVDLIIADLEIDFDFPPVSGCAHCARQSTAIVQLTSFRVEFTVYEEAVVLDYVRMTGMEGVKICRLQTGFLERKYLARKIRGLLKKNQESISHMFEYNIAKMLNTVLRTFNRAD